MDELTLKWLQLQQEAEVSANHVSESLQLWLHGILLYVLLDLSPLSHPEKSPKNKSLLAKNNMTQFPNWGKQSQKLH